MMLDYSEFELRPDKINFGSNGVGVPALPGINIHLNEVRNEFIQLIFNEFNLLSNDNSYEEEILFLVLPELTLEFLSVINACLLKESLSRRSLIPKYGQQGYLFEPIGKNGAPTKNNFSEYLQAGLTPQPLLHKFLRPLKGLVVNDGLKRKPQWLINNHSDIICFSSSSTLEHYSKKIGQRIVLSRYDQWFKDGSPTANVSKSIFKKGTFEKIFSILDEVATQSDINLSIKLKSYFKNQLEVWGRCVAFHQKYLNSKKDRLPKEFWSGTAGSIFNRIFSNEVRKNGGFAVGFDHGTGIGLWDYPAAPFETNYFDKFITYTEAMAYGISNNVEKDIKRGAGANVFVEGIQSKDAFHHKDIVKAQVVKNKIIYITTVFIGEGFCVNQPLPDVIYLDLQLKIISTVVKNKFDLKIRPHPESKVSLSTKYEEMFNCEVLEGGLSTAIEDAEVLIFDYPFTSAFRDALYANKPIILIDFGQHSLQPKFEVDFNKRVYRVKAELTSENKIEFNERELIEGIRNAKELVNIDFVRKFYGLWD